MVNREKKDAGKEGNTIFGKEFLVLQRKKVCGMRKIGGGRKRQGGEWWNNEVKQLVREKKCMHINPTCGKGKKDFGRNTGER